MTIKFDVNLDDDNNIIFVTNAEGNDIIRAPLLNKGTAFTKQERETLGLDGLIPARILTIDQQIQIIYQRYQRLGFLFEKCKSSKKYSEHELKTFKKTVDIARYNFLRDLHDRNEILYYAFCHKYMQGVIPIIYTPTVGEAVIRYSRESARFRGIFLSPLNIDKIGIIFDRLRFKKPAIAVVTDNQGILGLGDQGVGGIEIPIGKLSLYVLGAGIRPWETMPLTLDVGTDNPNDLKDSYYLGYKAGRLVGEEYRSFIYRFVEEIRAKFPNILIQWEDFSRQNAFTVLDEYRYKILSFNDDIQGTGSVALAGIINAMKISGENLKDQKFVVYGAGAGGVGIARRIAACLRLKYKISERNAFDKIAIVDSKGLVTNEREVADYKKPFSKTKIIYDSWHIKNIKRINLLEIIKNFGATVLIGTSGRAGHFKREVIEAMSVNAKRPVIFPLSNPTSNSEATPKEIYKYSNGKAIVATGSPFEPFTYNGKTINTGQGNNFFIFPGVGLGAILSKGKYINDEVFTEVAYKLSDLTPKNLMKKGTIYPKIKDIRNISAHLALTTTQKISEQQGTHEFTIDEIKKRMWKSQYHPIIKIS